MRYVEIKLATSQLVSKNDWERFNLTSENAYIECKQWRSFDIKYLITIFQACTHNGTSWICWIRVASAEGSACSMGLKPKSHYRHILSKPLAASGDSRDGCFHSMRDSESKLRRLGRDGVGSVCLLVVRIGRDRVVNNARIWNQRDVHTLQSYRYVNIPSLLSHYRQWYG